jgi:hypothetical protein
MISLKVQDKGASAVLTRYAGPDDNDRSTCVVFVSHRDFGPWLCAAHLNRYFLFCLDVERPEKWLKYERKQSGRV